MNQWYDFLVVVFQRYGHHSNIVWGIWNEPNLHAFLWDNENADHYFLLFATAHNARNIVNPNIRLGAPETSSLPGTSYFHQAMNKISPYLAPNDVITVHWYPTGDLCGYMYETATRAGGRQVWLTETGSGDSNEATQAFWVSTIASWSDTCFYSWNRTFIYRLSPGVSEAIVNGDWSNRQAFVAYKNYIGGRSPGPPQPPPGDATFLTAGQQLTAEASVFSPNSQFELKYQGDGNLVLYSGPSPQWAINCWPTCADIGGPGRAEMQHDGNFVVYNSQGVAVWASATDGNSGAYLSVHNDGRLIVYSASGAVLWSR